MHPYKIVIDGLKIAGFTSVIDNEGDIKVSYNGRFAFYIFVFEDGIYKIKEKTFTADTILDEVLRLCTLVRLGYQVWT